MRSLLRPFLVLAAALCAVLLSVTACSPPDEEQNSGEAVQVNTPQGPVTVNGTPERIVTLGAQWIDTALAFGVTPVGYLDNIQILTGNPSPWTKDKLGDSTALNPETLVADVAKLEPDLILAEGHMAESQPETFKKISEIAPTIPGVSGKQVDPWQDLVTLMGTLLHDQEKADEITANVNAKIDDVKSRMPGLAGKSYSMAWMTSSEQIMVMADPNDGAGYLFNTLGMKVAPALAEQFAENKKPRFPISTENIPMLESDLLVLAVNSDELLSEFKEMPGQKKLTAVENDAVSHVSVADISGLNQPTPLSIPYLLDKMEPALKNAAD